MHKKYNVERIFALVAGALVAAALIAALTYAGVHDLDAWDMRNTHTYKKTTETLFLRCVRLSEDNERLERKVKELENANRNRR